MKTSWGGVADWYDELLEQSPDSFQEKVILPNLTRLVEPKKGMTILDVACGQGYFARAFHGKGARVVGVDISPELIELAKKRSLKEIKFYVAPADDLAKVPPSPLRNFDAITMILALQNIENCASVFIGCAKILKPNGRLIIVLNHPAFRVPKRSSWEWDEKGKKQYRRIDAYMSDSHVEIDMTPGETRETKKKYTVSFHRPLQSYFKALNKSGFAVTRLEEWISHKESRPGPRAEEEDRARKEIPMFLCFEARVL